MPDATTEPPQGRISSVGAIGRDQTRLEVGADDDWEERWARWQRISWAAMAVVLLLGIVGFFGRGPVDHATAIAAKGLFRVGYEPVIRFRTPTVLTLHISPELAGENSVVSIRSNASLLTALQIRHADPQPQAWDAAADGPTRQFHVSSPGTEVTVDLEVEPAAIGLFSVEFTAGNLPAVSLHQLVLP
jgi:hypothetical protein